MRTVKELSDLTGISVRTLHYYDEIGLFKPTAVSEAGYRLYDDRAVERLEEILVFRELALPLADIKLIMDSPNMDHNMILEKQRKMLCRKRERIDRIIATIDSLLKEGHRMDLTVFDETELQEMFSDMLQNMNGSQKQIFIEHYGSIEAWKRHVIEGASDEKTQRDYAKVVEWYGSKDAAMKPPKTPPKSEVFTAYQKRIGDIQKRIAEMKGTDVNSFEVKKLVGEYDFVARQLYQMDDVQKLLLDIAARYQEDQQLMKGIDSVYGEGAAQYIGAAIKAFYSPR